MGVVLDHCAIGKSAPKLREKRNELALGKFAGQLGLGMSSRAQYYWRQADICMRLSLLSEDGDVAELLINKAMELMWQAESAAAEDGKAAERPNGDDDGGREGEPH